MIGAGPRARRCRVPCRARDRRVAGTSAAAWREILSHDPAIDRVVGVDVVPPRADIGGAEFVRADIRNPIIGKVIAAAGVDTVVHMGVSSTPVQAGGRVSMKEINVIGTMQLLAACQKADGISRLVVKSTSSVYGAGPKDPAMFTEDTEPRSQPRSGWAKDSVEVEGYVRGFARRRPDVAVTHAPVRELHRPQGRHPDGGVLRAAGGADGARATTPRLQFVHEDDGLEAIRLAALGDHPGTFNVAGDGILMLSQALRLAGRPILPVPTPLVGLVGGWFRRAGLADFSPEQIKFLTYGRGLDTTRLRDRFGFDADATPRATRSWSSSHDRGLDRRAAQAPCRGASSAASPHALGTSTLSEARLVRATAGGGDPAVPDATVDPDRRRGRRPQGRVAAPRRAGRRHRSAARAAQARRSRPADRRRARAAAPTTPASTSAHDARRRPGRRLDATRRASGSTSCAAGSPASTRSTSSASTPSSPTACSWRRCARSTRSGSASRRAASRTCRPRAARSSSPTTPARSRSTR